MVFIEQEPEKTFEDQKDENDKYHLRLVEIKIEIYDKILGVLLVTCVDIEPTNHIWSMTSYERLVYAQFWY